MKIYLLLLIFFSLSATAYSQWVLQYPVTQFVNLRDVDFANDQTGWVCGDGGLILKTTNQGQNWIQQTSGTSKRIESIAIATEDILFAAGQFQLILKTTNGGTNWQILSEGQSGPSYYSTFFLNKDTGFVAGSLQNVWRTTNGGLNFNPIYIPKSSWFYDMYFRNDMEGIMSGDGSIYKTSDGGNTWETIWIETSRFDELSFVNNDTGFIVGQSNQVYKTMNFGSTWDSLGYVPNPSQNGASYSIRFINQATGWVGGTFGYMFKTTNGGYHWYEQDMSQFNQGFIEDIFFINDTTGWAVGAATKILYTTNGGGPVLSILNISNEIPSGFDLSQNFPNPFNTQTTINFKIPKSSSIKLEVFDILGRIVDSEDFGFKTAGEYRINYNADKLSSGIYFYKLITRDGFQIKKFTLVK